TWRIGPEASGSICWSCRWSVCTDGTPEPPPRRWPRPTWARGSSGRWGPVATSSMRPRGRIRRTTCATAWTWRFGWDRRPWPDRSPPAPAGCGDWTPMSGAECLRGCRGPVGRVALAVEPLNRYETSIINAVAEALEALDPPLGDGIGLALDSYHLNLEERSPAAAIRAAGPHLRVMQVCGNDRGPVGGDHTD